MRAFVVFVLLGLLCQSVAAVGVLPIVHSPIAAPGDSLETADGPHLLLLLENRGSATTHDVTVQRDSDGTVVFDGSISTPAHEVSRTVVPASQARYTITIGSLEGSVSADSRGCSGAFVVRFIVSGSAWSYSGSNAGCVVPPPAYFALLEQATSSTARDRKDAIAIPLPRDGDRGAFNTSADDAPRPFWWETDITTPDAWGRDQVVHEARYREPEDSVGTAFGAVGSGQALIPATIERFVYARDGTQPFAYTTRSGTASAGVASTWATTIHETRFASPATLLSCLFRSGLQGTRIAAGDAPPSASFCPWLAESGGRWMVGASTPRDGLQAMPLYLVNSNETSTRVTRAWFADGIAYPIELETYLVATDRPARHARVTLIGHEPAGDPISRAPSTQPSPPAPPTSPIDPRLGPAFGSAGSRVSFPLHDAASAALNDLGLVLAEPTLGAADVALTSAAMRAVRDGEGPSRLQWTLLFTTRTSSALIVCERPAQVAPAPTTKCIRAENAPNFAANDIGAAPLWRVSDVPRTGLGFDEALARLDAFTTAGAIDYVNYRPWESKLAIGRNYAIGNTFASVEGTSAADFIVVDLLTGAASTHVEGVQQSSGIESFPTRLTVGSDADARGARTDAGPPFPFLAGASAMGLGLLALIAFFWNGLKTALVGLFTRLVRPRILDAEVRASIHELVEAKPGVHASEIIQHFNRGTGLIAYHLDVLVREAYLTCLQTTGFKRYFVTGRFSPAEMRAIAALHEGQAEKLFRIIEAHPGIHMSELAQRAGLSLPHTSKTVKRMAEAGLVDQVKVGRAVRLHALER